MSNEQPLVSVGSNNRIGNRNTIFIGVFVFSVTGCILLGYALWPYLHAIGLALTLLIYLLIGVIAALVAYIPIYLIRRGETDLAHRRAIAGFVPLGEHGGYRLSSDGAEPLHPPLLLPAPPVQVTEVKTAPDRSQDEETILELHSHGSSFKSIAQSYKDADPKTYWTEYRVRQLCNARKYGGA